MKRFIYILTVMLVCGALSCPSIEARGRNNGNNGGGSQPTHNNSGSTSRPGKNPTIRPGNNGAGNNQGSPAPGNRPQTNRPNNNGGNGNNRPNPGMNNPGPGGGGQNPGNNFGPGSGGGQNPGNNPGSGGGWGHVPNYAPNRPMLPPSRPFLRPTPPAAFHPGPRYPVINTILGVTLGTAINLSLDYLYNHGYYITGYTNDAVYLNDVMQLNLIWPHATLYYEYGRLRASDFVYSTPYYDMDRYYNTYNRLVSAYGPPVSTNYITGGGMECNWFGYNNEYVTLRYTGGVAANGTNRFYTTLSFGR